MSIQCVTPGLQTTIQDQGRTGHMHNGVAHSGAMDAVSALMANWLVGNSDDSPLLEITLIGPTLKFTVNITIAIVGARFSVYLNEREVFNNKTININSGDTLRFGRLKAGARAYMAFAAGININKMLGSYATNMTARFGGLQGRAMRTGDEIPLNSAKTSSHKQIPERLIPQYTGCYLFRSVPTIETHRFDKIASNQFYDQKFTVSPDSNRMGIRLKGLPIINKLTQQQMVSSGLTQGSIQIPASGIPVISSVDGQTIGGYPRIANIASVDLPLLGQLKAGDRISFCPVSREKSLLLLKNKQQLLQRHLYSKLFTKKI